MTLAEQSLDELECFSVSWPGVDTYKPQLQHVEKNGWASQDLKALGEIYQSTTEIEDASHRSYFSSDDQTKAPTDALDDFKGDAEAL